MYKKFNVVAKFRGDSVEFSVMAQELKEALDKAHTEAERVFSYVVGERPSVAVKPAKSR